MHHVTGCNRSCHNRTFGVAAVQHEQMAGGRACLVQLHCVPIDPQPSVKLHRESLPTMKMTVLAGAACLTLTALTAPAAATTFTYTDAIVDYAIPVAGQYTISAIGARGGSVLDQGGAGGLGAEARGTFSFAQGDVLRILVGAAGADNPVVSQGFESFGGGGGGSFVVGPNAVPLVVAGGGGGGGQLNASYPPDFQQRRGGSRYNGGDALTGPDGGAATVSSAAGGTGGGGAGGAAGANGQGGTFIESGGFAMNAGRGFNAFPSGLGTGAFGGGGLADDNAGAGGGGGYSGGGGGGFADVSGTLRYGFGGGGGGGGGSFTVGADPSLLARIGTGDGQVSITAVATAVPEPGSLALLGLGLFGATAFCRSRRR